LQEDKERRKRGKKQNIESSGKEGIKWTENRERKITRETKLNGNEINEERKHRIRRGGR
jgi:hypothetical protein